MKHLFIVNPVAGGKDRTEEIDARARGTFCQRDDDYGIYVTKGPMDAARAVKEAAEGAGELRVYACGGDGTYNECVCGAAGLGNVAVAPFATGTGNDFIRMFGGDMPLFKDVDALVNGSPVPMDVIDCNGRICANIASVGFDARVGTDVHKYSNIPLIGGAAGYVASLGVNFILGLHRPMRISGCGYEGEGEYTMVCVCNGRYYGGGFNPVPEAEPDDGLLDVLLVGKVGVLQAASVIGRYKQGLWRELPGIITHHRCRAVCIRCEKPSVVNVDGEAIWTDDAKIEVVPRAVRFFYPKGLTYHAKINTFDTNSRKNPLDISADPAII